jgi:hypothetical protein
VSVLEKTSKGRKSKRKNGREINGWVKEKDEMGEWRR